MNKLTLLLLTLFALTATSFAANLTVHDEEMKILWSTWKINHDKNYSVAEEHQRMSVFADNHNKINAHNANSTNTVTLAHNKFSDLTGDEFKSQYTGGFVPSLQPSADRLLRGDGERVLSSLPASFDWRSKGAVTPVKNQKSCDGCWSFSAAAALEGLHYIKTGALLDFSNQQLLDCDKSSRGCSGGNYANGFSYTAEYGILTLSEYPFVQKTESTCKYSSMSSKAYKVNTGHTQVKSNNANALMAAIVNQPVSIAIEANQSVFQFYKSGVITSGCGSKTDHAVLAVGFTTVNGVKSFIVKNSWGTGWGESGYVYISTSSANNGEGVCGILAYPGYPTV